MIPFNPTDRIAAALEAQQWNQVMKILADAPYRIVAPIIQSLSFQLNAAGDRTDEQVTEEGQVK